MCAPKDMPHLQYPVTLFGNRIFPDIIRSRVIILALGRAQNPKTSVLITERRGRLRKEMPRKESPVRRGAEIRMTMSQETLGVSGREKRHGFF